MRFLELFSGTGSFSKIARKRGHKCFTIDNNKNFKPDLCKDVLKLRINEILFKPDVLWSSPPCIDYSHAKRKGAMFIEYSNMLVIKTLSLITALKPKFWIIENPQTSTLKFQYFMIDLPYSDVSYCKYGKPYRKQTRLWNNFGFNGEVCDKNCDFMIGKKHICSVGNARKKYSLKFINKVDKAVIPEKLCLEIIKQIEVKNEKD